jgi:WD40 repeat protein
LGDNFCGVWKSTNQRPESGQQPNFHELVDFTEIKMVSALAWDPDGDILAVATYNDPSGEILLFDGQELNLMEALPASQKAITSLRWHTRGLRLIGVAPYSSDMVDTDNNTGSTILLWDLSRSPNIAGPLSMSVPEILVDMDCASFGVNGIVCAAGGNAVYHCRAFSDLGIEQTWKSNPNENDQWTFVRCAWNGPTDGIVVAASGDTSCLWLPAQDLMKREAHAAPITGLELRPRPSGASSTPSNPEFATSSTDGTVKVWRYDDVNNTLVSLCKLIVGHASPVMTISYSPDGFSLAGGGYDTVRIWNAGHSYNHMATWQGDADSWDGSKLKEDDMMSVGGMSGTNGEGSLAIADHTLAWDTGSKKLAFGLGSQVGHTLCC